MEKLIKELAYYARVHLDADELDEIYFENILLSRFSLTYPYEGEIDKKRIEEMKVPDALLDELSEKSGNKDSRFRTEIMGLLSPRPSVVKNKFFALRNSSHPEDALKYLFDLEIKNNYIQKSAIDRNIVWEHKLKDNSIEITINLSKPEKNNKDIAKLLTVPASEKKYPECLLCKTNLGFGGTLTHPARQNIRIIPFKLNGENFFMQYSPYAYYNEHVIVIKEEHSPMKITKNTFARLADFVDQVPEYFLGSNCDLPIVGGSILNHEHYQGGEHVMPLMKAQDRSVIVDNDKLKVSCLNWFNSCIKIETSSKEELVSAMEKIRAAWYEYENIDLDIIPYTSGVRHNGITPVVRKVNGKFTGFVILRNNRTSEEYPDGIYHAHKEYHNIKKEGIGLIEAMGLYILPGRLKRQLGEIESILVKSEVMDLEKYYADHEDMRVHDSFIRDIIRENGVGMNVEDAHRIIKEKVNKVCEEILLNTAVFKNNERGNKACEDFVKSIGL